MSSNNRFAAVLYMVVAFAIVAITYFGPKTQVEQTLRMLVLTVSIVVAVYALFRRSAALFLISAGLFLEMIDPSKRILFYAGLVVFLGGFALYWSQHGKIHSGPTPTG